MGLSLGRMLTRRDPISLRPVEYYSKLPTQCTAQKVIIADPVLASGNTIIAAIQSVLQWGVAPADIIVIAVLTSQAAADKVSRMFPDVSVSTSATRVFGRGVQS